jgi:hypothetical protein
MNTCTCKNNGLLMMLTVGVVVIIIQATVSIAFTIPQPISNCVRRTTTTSGNPFIMKPLFMAEGTNGESQVVELVDDNIEEQSNEIATTNEPKEEGTSAAAPFLSQGEISEEAMEMNWNDPKQTRVMFYIILSLVPVLFLIPLMLGSRDLIPIDALPPVPLS